MGLLDCRLLLLTLFLATSSASDPAPFSATWSSETYGYDGPWPAIQAYISTGEDDLTEGASGTLLNLYPGSFWESWIITTDYCRSNTSDVCYASKAGTYDHQVANLTDVGSDGRISFPASLDDFGYGMDVVGEQPQRWVDTLSFGPDASSGPHITNSSLVLLESQMFAYPGGQWYPFSGGCLSLGAPHAVNQSFTTDLVALNSSLVPGYLWEHGQTPSNSFGLHIGSASPKLGGSLWFGGYDQNRVVADVLTIDGSFNDDGVTLKDITIDVIKGNSPFDFRSKSGLLAEGNSTIGNGLKVIVDGCSPYLSLPKSTCDSIASNLPVNYDEKLGLYLWNVTSPEYRRIIPSASALTFTFFSESNTDLTSIHVPFAHLNLTLTSPLVEFPTSYFPCFNSGNGRYTLGRAFLQDAFIGANWGAKNVKSWLAQAPGPNVQAVSRVTTIGEDDESISKGENDWEASWSGVWVELSDEKGDNDETDHDETGRDGASHDRTDHDAEPKGGISQGAKIGIGVSAAIAGLLVLGAIAFWLWRRKTRLSAGETPSTASADADTPGKEPMIQTYPAEVHGTPAYSRNGASHYSARGHGIIELP